MIGKYLLLLRDLAFIIPFNILIDCKNTFQIPTTLGGIHTLKIILYH